ncbi:MAG TPA: hypothetical protein VEB66_15795 [Opitutaceae bacterium]|nr:hypothetical protein [Opitutaceae bacterium]
MKSFLAGKKALEEAPLAGLCGTTHRLVPPTGAVRPVPAGPSVEVVKEGDKVVRLVVTCGCGERIEVECLYPAGRG